MPAGGLAGSRPVRNRYRVAGIYFMAVVAEGRNPPERLDPASVGAFLVVANGLRGSRRQGEGALGAGLEGRSLLHCPATTIPLSAR